MTIPFERLYRIFLYRVVDTELLSAGSDTSKLLGQLAVVPILVGVAFGFGALGLGQPSRSYQDMLISAWGLEHALIATTMLLTGLFTVLSWESTFPDLRDIMVLGPLPVESRSLFFAKLAALGAAQATVIAAINMLPGLVWPLALAPPSRNLLDLILTPQLYRTFVAFWITMFAAGGFVFLSVLAIQGILAHLMPRRVFLRVSAWLQLLSFCLFLSMYFLQPVLTTIAALSAESNQHLLHCLPAYWFLGVFQYLNGSVHLVMEPLAARGALGLSIVGGVAVVSNLLTYRRRLRQIVEQPELVPGGGTSVWRPQFGHGISNAILQFTLRTVLRSRQHRLLLAFYVGVGLSTVVLLIQTGVGRGMLSPLQQARTAFASAIIVTAWIVGVRVICSLPVSLKANWVFRITQISPAERYFTGARYSVLALSLIPTVIVSSAVFISIWPWQDAIRHVVILTLWSVTVAYSSLKAFRKIPFTCSFQPGKSGIHMRLLGIVGAVLVLGKATAYEQQVLRNDVGLLQVVAALALLALGARHLALSNNGVGEAIVEFEDLQPSALQGLGLYRDGVMVE